MAARRQIRIHFLCECECVRVFMVHRFDAMCQCVWINFRNSNNELDAVVFPSPSSSSSSFLLQLVVSCHVVRCAMHIDHVRVAVGFRYVRFSRSISPHLLFSARDAAKFLQSALDYNNESVATINSTSPERHTAHTCERNSVNKIFAPAPWEGLPDHTRIASTKSKMN